MALPVSWKPLVKSKANAVAISSTRMIVSVVTPLIVMPGGEFWETVVTCPDSLYLRVY